MAYFVGKDVKVWICTEYYGSAGTDTRGIKVGTDHELEVADNRTDSSDTLANGSKQIYSMAYHLGYPNFNISDVTGVDLTLGASDEEIAFFGTKTPGKIETKADCSITLTRKKSDIGWDGIFNNGGRIGCSGGTELSSLQEPTINTGYRIHVILSGSTDVFSVRGCCVQGHTVSVNADGTSEETMEFMSYITPKVTNAAVQTKLAITEI